MPSASIDSKGYMHQKAMAQWDRRGGGPKATRNSPQVAAVTVIFERFRTCWLLRQMPEGDDKKKIGQLKVEASKEPK